MTTVTRDVHDTNTWEQVEEPGLLYVCPACIVAVPIDNIKGHVEAKHTLQVREAIVHVTPEGMVVDFLRAAYDRQIAALHAEQYWEQDVVERALGAIYQFQRTGRLVMLQSTYDAILRAAVEWWGDEPR